MIEGLIKDKKLGVVEGKHRYDLPLNKDAGAGFLIVLIALMTLLVCAALSAFLLLGKTTHHWESALENKLSIEIPAEDENGKILENAFVRDLAYQTEKALNSLSQVTSVHVLEQKDVVELVRPWLGEDIVLDDFPLPVLMTVEVDDSSEETIAIVKRRLLQISPQIHVDTHETWLQSVMKLTGGLQFSALIVVLLIGAVTVVAIAGAMRMRMALHEDDVELLHLMGANDSYITAQFQRHALILALQGSACGLGFAFIGLMVFEIIASSSESFTATFLRFSFWDFAFIILLPLLICCISALSARHTVLRALGQMP